MQISQKWIKEWQRDLQRNSIQDNEYGKLMLLASYIVIHIQKVAIHTVFDWLKAAATTRKKMWLLYEGGNYVEVAIIS